MYIGRDFPVNGITRIHLNVHLNDVYMKTIRIFFVDGLGQPWLVLVGLGTINFLNTVIQGIIVLDVQITYWLDE